MRDILFITVDSLRADHLGSYGYGRETSSFLDSLGESGYRYRNSFAHAGTTRSSFPAIPKLEPTAAPEPAAATVMALFDAGFFFGLKSLEQFSQEVFKLPIFSI